MKKVKQTTEKKQRKLSLEKFKVASLDDFSKRKIQGGDEPIITIDDDDFTTTGANPISDDGSIE